MSSFADRNRERFLTQIQGDIRLEGGKALAAAALMRVSIMMLIVAGIIGAVGAQILFGEGGLQFGLGLVVGYIAYVAFVLTTMGPPRIIGAMAVLTNKKVVLLGSRRTGMIGDWKHNEIESIELLRKGNIIIMGKIAIYPVDGDRIVFFLSNRRMGHHFIEQYQQLRG
jgi:hypothetical protein